MFEISVKAHFSSAHQIRDYGGKCEQLHGHNWLVEAKVSRADVAEDGMVMDFAILKQKLKTTQKFNCCPWLPEGKKSFLSILASQITVCLLKTPVC